MSQYEAIEYENLVVLFLQAHFEARERMLPLFLKKN